MKTINKFSCTVVILITVLFFLTKPSVFCQPPPPVAITLEYYTLSAELQNNNLFISADFRSLQESPVSITVFYCEEGQNEFSAITMQSNNGNYDAEIPATNKGEFYFSINYSNSTELYPKAAKEKLLFKTENFKNNTKNMLYASK